MSEHSASTRAVRPWLAAMLSVFGWGLGFYYAGRTREAILWAAAGVLLPMALLIVLLLLGEFAGLMAPTLIVRALPWIATVLVAALAWRLAARTPSAAHEGPMRAWGYVALWFIPVLAALLLRFAVVQPFRNPSGAMQPTIQVGEYMIATKWAYGYSRFSLGPFQASLPPGGRLFARQPRRGDLVVFRPLPEPERDFVKRLIGLPGDRIQMVAGILHINGQPISRQSLGLVDFVSPDIGVEHVHAFRETLPSGGSYVVFDRGDTELDTTQEYVVPEGHYFMLGDDRDNSADSRVPMLVGFVPFENLVGRIDAVLGVPDQAFAAAP